jgi:hypothetical protein
MHSSRFLDHDVLWFMHGMRRGFLVSKMRASSAHVGNGDMDAVSSRLSWQGVSAEFGQISTLAGANFQIDMVGEGMTGGLPPRFPGDSAYLFGFFCHLMQPAC